MMPDLVTEGLQLAAVGMGFVFIFLVMLILLTMLLSRLVMLTEPEQPAASLPGAAKGKQADRSKVADQQLLAVITSAVMQHRSRRQKR